MKLRFEVQILSVMLCYFNHISIAADQDNRNSDKTSKKVDTKDITGASGNLYRVLMHQHIDEEKIEEGDDVNVKQKHNNFRMWNIQSRGFFHETQNCMNLTLQMDSIISFGPSKFVPTSMNQIRIPQTATVSNTSYCDNQTQALVIEWENSDVSLQSLTRNLSIFMKTGEDTNGDSFYWISHLIGFFQVDDDGDRTQFIKVRSLKFNPLGAFSANNRSYNCGEPRSAELEMFLISENQERKLKSGVIKTKWLVLLKPEDVEFPEKLKTFSSCYLHSRDFVPEIVGFSLVGVVAFVIIFWCVGRKHIEPHQLGYNIQHDVKN